MIALNVFDDVRLPRFAPDITPHTPEQREIIVCADDAANPVFASVARGVCDPRNAPVAKITRREIVRIGEFNKHHNLGSPWLVVSKKPALTGFPEITPPYAWLKEMLAALSHSQ